MAEDTPQAQDGATPEQLAARVMEEARKERVQKCNAQIAQALETYECTLDVAMLITSRGNQPQVIIVPKPSPQQ